VERGKSLIHMFDTIIKKSLDHRGNRTSVSVCRL